MKFEITKWNFGKGFVYFWSMKTNNGVFLAESTHYKRKSDCLRAIKKHFFCKILRLQTSKAIIAIRPGRKFATIIDKTK